MKYAEIKEEVERICAGEIPQIDWEQLIKLLDERKEITLTDSFTRSLAIFVANEYKLLKSRPSS